MCVPSRCGLVVLVVLGCVLPTILAAPANAGEQGQNGLVAHQNDTDKSEEVDENPFAAAAFVAKYGCSFAKIAAGLCRFVRNGEIDDNVMMERSEDEDVDQLDMNKIREIVRNYGCPVIKGVAGICGVFSG